MQEIHFRTTRKHEHTSYSLSTNCLKLSRFLLKRIIYSVAFKLLNFTQTITLYHLCKGKYKKIFALEPDKQNFQKLKNKIARNAWENIEIYNCASWSSEDVLKFSGDAQSSTGNRLSADGEIWVKANSIDAILGVNCIGTKSETDKTAICHNDGDILLGGAILIKMDVEGAELESLKGAQNTLLKYKPQLAICIYHSDEDMLSIAEYIHEWMPDYKMYVRHHTCNLGDTVLYCVM